MVKQEPEYLLLKSVSDRIYYSSRKFVPINSTSLGKNPGYQLPRRVYYFWVEILSYHPGEGKLVCKHAWDCVTEPSPYPSDTIEKRQSQYEIQYLDFGIPGQVQSKHQASESRSLQDPVNNAVTISRPRDYNINAPKSASPSVAAENPPIHINGTYLVPVGQLIFRTG
jgi:hypothetical protein